MMVSKYQKARIFLVSVLVINANIKTQCELDSMLAMNKSSYYCEKSPCAQQNLPWQISN